MTHSAGGTHRMSSASRRSRNAKERRNKIDGSRHCLRRNHRSLAGRRGRRQYTDGKTYLFYKAAVK